MFDIDLVSLASPEVLARTRKIKLFLMYVDEHSPMAAFVSFRRPPQRLDRSDCL